MNMPSKPLCDQDAIDVACSIQQGDAGEWSDYAGPELSTPLTLIEDDMLCCVEDDQSATVILRITPMRLGAKVTHGKLSTFIGDMYPELFTSIFTRVYAIAGRPGNLLKLGPCKGQRLSHL